MVLKRTVLFLMITLSLITAVLGMDINDTAPQNKFLGKWVNVDPETRDISSIVVKKENDSWTIQAWGKCHPTDCEWGAVPLNMIGDSTTDKTFDCAFAEWKFDFSMKYLTMRIQGDKLVVEKITVFKDNSNRSNYRSLDLMKRSKE